MKRLFTMLALASAFVLAAPLSTEAAHPGPRGGAGHHHATPGGHHHAHRGAVRAAPRAGFRHGVVGRYRYTAPYVRGGYYRHPGPIVRPIIPYRGLFGITIRL